MLSIDIMLSKIMALIILSIIISRLVMLDIKVIIVLIVSAGIVNGIIFVLSYILLNRQKVIEKNIALIILGIIIRWILNDIKVIIALVVSASITNCILTILTYTWDTILA